MFVVPSRLSSARGRIVPRPGFSSLISAACLALCVPLACGGSTLPGEVPEPSFSESPRAQEAFRKIQGRWLDGDPTARARLEPELRDFLARFARDDRVRVVRCYLGVLELERQRPAEARALVASVRRGPPGAVRDFATLVHAAALRREGKLDEALALLLPLQGKVVEPGQQGLFSKELVRALIDARKYLKAIEAMLDWAEQAPPGEREQVVTAVEGWIRSMPRDALEAGLGLLYQAPEGESESGTRVEAGRWLGLAVRERLTRIALTERDADLARRLIEMTPPRLGRDDVREVLSELAATSSSAARVEGRALGVVLDVTDEASKRRSSDVIAGMTRALGLPAKAERADSIRLLTRDSEGPSEVDRALSGLAGDGATLLVAGVTDEAAVSAALFAERTKTPVILLRRPPGARSYGPFTFVLGTDASEEESAIHAGLEGEGARAPVRVGSGGAPCDAPSGSAFGARFPTAEWKRAKADAIVLAGDADCAREATLEALAAGLSPLIVLGLEAVDAAPSLPGRKILVSAGRFPFAAHPLAPEEQAHLDRWGTAPSWYAVLGRDAALLAEQALAALPSSPVQEEQAVTKLHRRARDGLARARAPLWSTDARGFEGAQSIARRLWTARAQWGTRK